MSRAGLHTMTRFLGVDAGEARIGLAIGDDTTRLALPLAIIERRGRGAGWAAQTVAERARQLEVDGMVVGLPLNIDGSAGSQARRALAFGQQLEAAAAIPVEYWDERLSTVIAAQHRFSVDAAEKPARGRGRRLDDVAAAVILQSFLDARQDARKR